MDDYYEDEYYDEDVCPCGESESECYFPICRMTAEEYAIWLEGDDGDHGVSEFDALFRDYEDDGDTEPLGDDTFEEPYLRDDDPSRLMPPMDQLGI